MGVFVRCIYSILEDTVLGLSLVAPFCVWHCALTILTISTGWLCIMEYSLAVGQLLPLSISGHRCQMKCRRNRPRKQQFCPCLPHSTQFLSCPIYFLPQSSLCAHLLMLLWSTQFPFTLYRLIFLTYSHFNSHSEHRVEVQLSLLLDYQEVLIKCI